MFTSRESLKSGDDRINLASDHARIEERTVIPFGAG